MGELHVYIYIYIYYQGLWGEEHDTKGPAKHEKEKQHDDNGPEKHGEGANAAMATQKKVHSKAVAADPDIKYSRKKDMYVCTDPFTNTETWFRVSEHNGKLEQAGNAAVEHMLRARKVAARVKKLRNKASLMESLVAAGCDDLTGTNQDLRVRLAKAMLADQSAPPPAPPPADAPPPDAQPPAPPPAEAPPPAVGAPPAQAAPAVALPDGLRFDPVSQAYFCTVDIIGEDRRFEELSVAKEFLVRVKAVKCELKLLKSKTKSEITTRMFKEDMADNSGTKLQLLDRLARHMLTCSTKDVPAGETCPLPCEQEAGAGPPLASGVDVADELFAVEQMPAPKRKVHCDFHMGDFVIERFKQYIAPYKASGVERMAWILGRQETLNKKSILQAWGLFIPRDAWQSIGTDGWQTSEDRWDGGRGE